MAHAEKCPVCGGSGRLPTNDTAITKPCHGCGGMGWITVGYEPIPYYPIYPQPYSPWWIPTITYTISDKTT